MTWALSAIFAFVFLIFPLHGFATEKLSWPMIKSQNFQYTLTESGSKSVFHLITGNDGNPAYLFLAYLNAGDFEDQDNYSLSGDFECIMIPLYEKVENRLNLFFYYKNPSRMWDHRGRFFMDQIDDNQHSSDPGWGRERIFKLRKMQITIRVINYNIKPVIRSQYNSAENNKQKFDSLKFELDIVNEPSVSNPIDERYQTQ